MVAWADGWQPPWMNPGPPRLKQRRQMSKQRKTKQSDKPPTRPPARRGLAGVAAAVLVVAILAVLGVWWNQPRRAGGSSTVAPPVATTTTNAPAAVAEPKPDFQALKGRWLRPDGGYVIEVKSVDAAGKMDAAYFNPRSIHVARAEASRAGAFTKVFIELRDVNYPGSTYTLAHDPTADRLVGNYFQAMLRENYDVVFVRER